MSRQSSVVANRSVMAASRPTISPKRSRTRPQRSCLVLCAIAPKRSTCSPLVGNPGEAVAVLREADPGRPRRGGDVLVSIENDLCAERGMPRHLDRQIAPLRIHDVKRVVIDVSGPLRDVADDLSRAHRP